MRQIIYASVSCDRPAAELAPAILRQSRVHNGIDGITGLLCAREDRFMQVLEGPRESVALTLERILADPRHHRIELLTDRAMEARDFGDWTMAYRDRGQGEETLDERLRVLLAGVPTEVADRFRTFTLA